MTEFVINWAFFIFPFPEEEETLPVKCNRTVICMRLTLSLNSYTDVLALEATI